ncbi:hypothetical protein HDV00_008197 [Rhizophlyctis rosea]|nr:hypothetical protein HDV00_008197 [Rhizophlyctis rosea]
MVRTDLAISLLNNVRDHRLRYEVYSALSSFQRELIDMKRVEGGVDCSEPMNSDADVEDCTGSEGSIHSDSDFPSAYETDESETNSESLLDQGEEDEGEAWEHVREWLDKKMGRQKHLKQIAQQHYPGLNEEELREVVWDMDDDSDVSTLTDTDLPSLEDVYLPDRPNLWPAASSYKGKGKGKESRGKKKGDQNGTSSGDEGREADSDGDERTESDSDNESDSDGNEGMESDSDGDEGSEPDSDGLEDWTEETVIRQIEEEQNTDTAYRLNRAHFKHLCAYIGHGYRLDGRFTSRATKALQRAAEDYLTDLMRCGYLIASENDREYSKRRKRKRWDERAKLRPCYLELAKLMVNGLGKDWRDHEVGSPVRKRVKLAGQS